MIRFHTTAANITAINDNGAMIGRAQIVFPSPTVAMIVASEGIIRPEQVRALHRKLVGIGVTELYQETLSRLWTWVPSGERVHQGPFQGWFRQELSE